jgi:hypothetical protein
VERVLNKSRNRNSGALEYAAAMTTARRAIVEGRVRDAAAPLSRARAVSPLDGEAMALLGLVNELEGHDREADHAYRAALALQQERVTEDVSASEGLARLRAYAGARAVPSFDHHGRRTLWFVADGEAELSLGPIGIDRPDVVVFTLGLVPVETGAVYARLSGDKQAFLISTSAASERLALRIAHSFEGSQILAHPATLGRIGLSSQRPTPIDLNRGGH